MAQQELIDSIVTNESLGIRKKPSLLKILLIAVLLLVAAYVAYMFYVKANTVTEVLPPLELGQPLEKAPQPIGQASTELGQLTIMADEQKTHNDLIASQLAGNAVPAQPTNLVAAAQGQLPVAPASITDALAPATKAIQQPLPASVDITNAQPANNPPAKALPVSEKLMQTITADEQVVDVATVVTTKKQKIKRKKALKKAPKEDAQEDSAQAVPMEEGVTREEIIVIQ